MVRAVQAGDAAVLADARRVGRYPEAGAVDDARELAGRLLTTVYMGSQNSSKETRDRWGRWAALFGGCIPRLTWYRVA